MRSPEFAAQLNVWGKERVPFFFLTDFELENLCAWRLSDIDSNHLLFDFNGFTNSEPHQSKENIGIQPHPESLQTYQTKFEKVFQELEYGNSFLTNLTIRTPVELTSSLKEIFQTSKAKYKLWKKDQFVVFSPECFVRIKDGYIYSYPMKGTIDASIPDAENKILTDPKEFAEHVTIVDLIRNDLSMVSKEVNVSKFRFVDEIKSLNKKLLQVSSEITGKLAHDYANRIGDIITTLLPAGSVSGAPKAKTLKIIHKAEAENRGYFTGVAGYFDGENLDSGVMIRFIEQEGNKYYYRSGGGITTQSKIENEYQEAIAKIYVPVY